MKSRITSILFVVAACTLLVGVFALTGCGESKSDESTLSPEILSDIGAYKVTANNAGENSAVKSGGAVKAEEGQVIVISTDLQEGGFDVEVADESGEKTTTKKVSEQALEICEVDPGSYDVGVTVNADGTTGTVLVCPVDAAEFEKQEHDLDATLAAMAAAEGSEASASSSAGA